ncbi:AMPK-gamma [Acrasis kona]|uniref:AMPK-gamma n=1 Tax=Acrasis kona TaxID=1008807 RepID=A0AAW2Z5E5_9EUKA
MFADPNQILNRQANPNAFDHHKLKSPRYPLHFDDYSELLSSVVSLFKKQTNYDCMPTSSKVMVFDMDLPIREAFSIAARNDIVFATLWDSTKSQLVGMLTVTDLIDLLIHFHDQTNVIQEIITHKRIREWREMQNRTRPTFLVATTPSDTLWEAIELMQFKKIHRLPVISSKGALLHIITHSHLLAHLVQNVSFDAPVFRYSIEELGLGTYSNIVTMTRDTKVYEAVCVFAKRKVSAIPIVDNDGIVIDVFSRYDIVYIVRDHGDYHLDLTLAEALKMKPKIPVFTCTKTESFEKVLRHLASTRIHRLVCIDDDSKVVGIVSISDIFNFFMKAKVVGNDDEAMMSRSNSHTDVMFDDTLSEDLNLMADDNMF